MILVLFLGLLYVRMYVPVHSCVLFITIFCFVYRVLVYSLCTEFTVKAFFVVHSYFVWFISTRSVLFCRSVLCGSFLLCVHFYWSCSVYGLIVPVGCVLQCRGLLVGENWLQLVSMRLLVFGSSRMEVCVLTCAYLNRK